MSVSEMPALAGVHHLKLPVTDLARSREWYRSRLGYQVQIEFVEQGQLMGYALVHPNGGPPLGLRLDPGRARAAAGFDYFAIGVPDKEAIDQLAARLDALGEQHAGVHWATIGWILPHLHDPDGHEVRFYTLQHHTEPDAGKVTTIDDPRETAGLREQAATRQPPDGPAAGAARDGLKEERCLRPGSGNGQQPPSPARTIGAGRDQSWRNPAAIPPSRPARPAAVICRAGTAVAGLARRLRGQPGRMDLRQLAGPAAVFFLWPPRPGVDRGRSTRYRGDA